jgi:ribulose-phosphate 3-epimerase
MDQKHGRIIIAPSILAADFAHLADEVRRAENAGADWLHLDVMDGHFVDNISFGPAFVGAVARSASLPLDVHLMIQRPDHYLPRFVPFADHVTVHVEASHDIRNTLRAIRDAGCTSGLALNPDTELHAVEPFLEEIDLLLVMTVQPGFGGQAFRPEMMEKVEQAAQIRVSRGLNFHIEVDGGIDATTAQISRDAGANVFVAGTSLFAASDMRLAVASLRGN